MELDLGWVKEELIHSDTVDLEPEMGDFAVEASFTSTKNSIWSICEYVESALEENQNWQLSESFKDGREFLPQNIAPQKYLRTMLHALVRQGTEHNYDAMESHIVISEIKVNLPLSRDKVATRSFVVCRLYSDLGVPVKSNLNFLSAIQDDEPIVDNKGRVTYFYCVISNSLYHQYRLFYLMAMSLSFRQKSRSNLQHKAIQGKWLDH